MTGIFPFFQGLKRAVKDLFPYSEHRLCVRHVWTNLRGKLNMGESNRNKELKDWLWNAARATFNVRL